MCYKGKRGLKLVSMRNSGWSLSILCLLFVRVSVREEGEGGSVNRSPHSHYYTRPPSTEAFDPGTLLMLLHNVRVDNSTCTIAEVIASLDKKNRFVCVLKKL